MKNKITKLIVVAVLFCSYNVTAFSQATVEFETITEALNYDGDRDAVKKLIITGSISGNDYSPTSEWSKFRTLNETFPNIEEVEILTSQDIPDIYEPVDRKGIIGLFYDSKVFHLPPNWLRHFSAPNVKKIGSHAFIRCSGLVSVNFPTAQIIADMTFTFSSLISADFPSATTIGESAFTHCDSLKSVNLPVITEIESAFFACPLLTSVSFGTGFTMQTEINFKQNVFGPNSYFPINTTSTRNIDLILGEYVLPEPDLSAKIWQSDNNARIDSHWNDTTYAIDYIWKSITIKTSSIEEIVRNSKINIFPNPTSDNFTISFELEKSCNMKIVLCDILGQELAQVYNGFISEGLFVKTHSTEHLTKGVYFLKIFIDGNIVVEKVVID